MFKIKWNKKQIDSLENKLNKIAKGISQNVSQGVLEALKNTQITAIRLCKTQNDGILVELVNVSDNSVKGRVYTDKTTFSFASFIEYGTGEYAELPHIGTTKTFIESGYEYWFIPVNKVEKKLHYKIININGQEFYLAHGVPAKPFMTPAGLQTREQNVEIIKKKLSSFIKEACK